MIKRFHDKIFDGKLFDIIEITYWYEKIWKNKYFNTTLFQNFAGLEKNINPEKIYYQTYSILKQKKELIQAYKKELKKQKNINFQNKILNNTLKYISNIIDKVILWLPFEIEKLWHKIKLSEDEINNRLQKINRIEQRVFWKYIYQKKKEVKKCIYLLENKLAQNNEILNSDETILFKKYIDKIISKTKVQNIIKNIKSNNKINNKKDYLNKKISRDQYISIFEKVFNIYNISKTIKVDTVWSISDSNKCLYIPENEDYKYLSLERILRLIKHEIESHNLVEKNNKKILWNFKSAKYLFKEEWLAMFNEHILFDQKYDNIDIYENMILILVGELFPWKELLSFLKIYYKLTQKNINPYTRFLRMKRNYWINNTWVQHKDLSYYRWTTKTINYIKNNWNYYDLYLWKIWFDEINETKEYISINNIKVDIPLFISERIIAKLEKKDNFSKYLKYKYKFIKELKIPKLNSNQEKKINEIIKIINSN